MKSPASLTVKPHASRLARRSPAPMALEARLMFDGAAVDTALAAVAAERAVQDATTSTREPAANPTANPASDTLGASARAGGANEAPVLSAGPGVNYTENANDTPVLIAPGITLSDDLFAGNLGGAVLTVEITNGQAGDQLTLRNEGNGPGQLGFAINQGTGAITYGGVTIGVFSSTNEGKSITITFANNVAPVVDPAQVTREAVEAVLKNLQFFNSAQNPVAGDRSVRFTLNDGGGTANGGAATGSVDYSVRVVAVNDAPTDIVLGTNPNDGAFGGTQVAPGNNLVGDLGRPVNPGNDTDGRYANANFGEIVVRQGDDGFDPIDITDIFPDGFNFCGKTYTGKDFFVGWNGYITFGQGLNSYTPSGISQSTVPIIAPMFLDFDTNGGKSTANWGADGGKSTGSNRIYVDKDPSGKVVTITFDDVGEYNRITNVSNAFQIRLWNKGGGDFDIEFRYEQVGWAKHGSAWTSAGWSAGDRKTFAEIEGSMTSDMANLASKSNIGQAGVFLWQVRDGGVRAAGVAVTENSAPGTVITPLATADVDDSNFTYEIRRADGSYGDSDGFFKVAKNATTGRWELLIADGANFDYETLRSHTVTLRVTDAGGGEGPGRELSYEKSFTIPVLNVNERPVDIVLSGNSVNENSAGGTVIGTLGTSDVDAGDGHTYTVVGGAADKFMVSGNQLVVKPGSVLDYETARTYSITIRSTDKGGLFREETFTIDLRNVYEPVWFDSVVSRPLYTENGASVTIDGNIRVLAPEGSFNGGYLQVAIAANGEGADVMSVFGSTANRITLSGSDVFHNGTLIGRLDGVENGRNGQPLRINLNAAASVESVQALARSVAFSSTSENPSAATRNVQFALSDGTSLATKMALVDVRPVNDAPSAVLPSSVVTERTNADPSATVYVQGLAVTDVDESGLLTVVLSSKDLGGDRYGRLTIRTGIAGGLDAAGVSGNGSGVVTLRGTLAQLNATLGASNGVAYTPGLGRDSVEIGNDRLTLQVTDSGGLVSTRRTDIVVIPGKPTAHSGNFVGAEDNAIGIAVDLSMLVTDLNLTNANYLLGTVQPGDSSLLNSFAAGREIRDGDGTLLGYRLEHGKLLLQAGTAINQGRFTYHADANWNGVESFNYVFRNSQQASEVAYIRLFVTPVNDAPTNVTPPVISGDLRDDGSLRQNGTYSGQGVWADIDNPQDELGYTYQWQIADDAAGTNLRDIDGATLAQYRTNHSEIGKFIRLKVTANDGELSSSPAYSLFKPVTNADPVLVTPPVAGPATESVPFSFTLPSGTFADADGDTLTYRATLADGSPLPAWLQFDPATRTFTGLPGGGDIGTLTLKVTAADGGPNPASATIALRVDGVPPPRPDVPTVPGGGLPPGGPVVAPGLPETPGLPPLPGIPDAGPGLPGGVGQPDAPGGGGLPWVGVPGMSSPVGWSGGGGDIVRPGIGNALVGEYSGFSFHSGLTRADGFPVRVLAGSNDSHALRVGSLLDNHELQAEAPFKVVVPNDAFVHTKADAVISLVATQADGSPLPPWVEFDASRGTFKGEPPAGFTGDLDIVITASDETGNLAAQKFRIRLGDPVLVGKPGLDAQLRAEGSHARAAERQALLKATRRAPGR